MTKVCYTKQTDSDTKITKTSTGQVGEPITLSIYQDGAIKEVRRGILINYSLNDGQGDTYEMIER